MLFVASSDETYYRNVKGYLTIIMKFAQKSHLMHFNTLELNTSFKLESLQKILCCAYQRALAVEYAVVQFYSVFFKGLFTSFGVTFESCEYLKSCECLLQIYLLLSQIIMSFFWGNYNNSYVVYLCPCTVEIQFYPWTLKTMDIVSVTSPIGF